MLNGCSGSVSDSDLSIEIIKPLEENTQAFSSSNHLLSTPNSLSGLDCIGILAGHLDGNDNKGSCDSSLGIEIPVASWDGLKTYSSTNFTTLKVSGLKSKPARIVLVGFKKPATHSICDKVDANFSPDDDGYSDAYVIGYKDLALAVGNNSATIKATFNSALTVEECDDSIWDSGGGLADGLLAFWNFDDASAGDNITDDSKGSNNLGWTGAEAASTPTAKIGGARNTSTTAGPTYNHISTTINNDLSLSTGEDYTIAAWFYFENAGPGDNAIFSTYNGTDQGYQLHRNASDQLVFTFGHGSGSGSTVMPAVLSVGIGSWQHIVLAVKNQANTGYVKICVNNTCNERALGANSAAAGTAPFIAGKAGEDHTDAIDAMGLWSRYLSNSNISELFNDQDSDGIGEGKQYPF